MSLYAPDPPGTHDPGSAMTRRQAGDVPLILTELNPLSVLDALDDPAQPLDLLTFGATREVCPKCERGGLKLVLRQSCVRIAHLLCPDCASCYDARYPDGAPALTI